ncbi:MAG: hypothetical protein ACI9E1_000311 [Cryomorphaceae bacterium]|jgi:hypothetical protein
MKGWLGFAIIAFFGLLTSLLSAEENKLLKKFPFKVSQGVAVDANYFYAINNTKVVKCEKKTGKVVATWIANKKEKAYAHFKHLNSATVIDGKLYGAHSRYGSDPGDCSVEIWDVTGAKLSHIKTLKLPRKYGSLTWIDQHSDGSWWMCYAVYGKNENKATRLVKYKYQDEKFTELKSWVFPEEVFSHWGVFSCSGGSWGPDGLLYTTGHGESLVHVLKIDKENTLSYVRSEKVTGLSGQAIAWDRFSREPTLWGIVRNKHVSSSLIK